MRVVVTGAAGFVGAAVVAALRASNHQVLGLDALIPQAHADASAADAGDVARLDVRDQAALVDALSGADLVCHQAAMVGAEVSAADLPLFASHNDLGTATLLAAMASAGVTRLVLASSMVVYGDGRYACEDHGEVAPAARSLADLRSGFFDARCPRCGRSTSWLPVGEDAPLRPRSGYAASKVAQEHYTAAWCTQTGGSALALRYHNVYGPGMPADTPYSGVAAMFRSCVQAGQPPRVFEDGGQMRDFVHVDDVAAANLLAVERVVSVPATAFESYNVCSGQPVSILEVARTIAAGSTRGRQPVVTGDFRPGDVRHVVASPDQAAAVLGFRAQIAPPVGLDRFAREPMRLPPGAAPVTRA